MELFPAAEALQRRLPGKADRIATISLNRPDKYNTAFMGLWRGLKPTISKVHGYCVGGGSELALCSGLVIASGCTRFGTPYSRVWSRHPTRVARARGPITLSTNSLLQSREHHYPRRDRVRGEHDHEQQQYQQ